jgi:phosphoribosylanthranilate isomerase
MSIKVKICGMTRPQDAAVAVAAGADLVGLVFYSRSPRCVTLERAAEIVRELPPDVLRVGLFVNPEPREVDEAVARCSLQMVQFHGDESPKFCRQFGCMTMKAFRVRGPKVLQTLRQYPTDAWLLDAFVPGAQGGTGQTFDWTLATQAVHLGTPVFLAGGLTAHNVAEAIRSVRPYGVDVSSGVESAPGRKDPEKVRDFVRAAREAAGSP